MRRPNDDDPGPPGGRAAERLKEFLRDRTADDGDQNAKANVGGDGRPASTDSDESCAQEKPGMKEE